MQIFANGVLAGAIYALVALAFSAAFQVTRTFDFALAANMTVGAFVAAVLYDHVAANYIVSIATGCIVAGTIGLLIELLIYGPLRRSSSPQLIILLSSLGVMIALLNAVSLSFGDKPRIIGAAITGYSLEAFTARITPIQLATLATTPTIGLLMWVGYSRTRWGVTTRAVACDQELALCFGLQTHHVVLQVAFLSSAIGGLAATLAAFDTGLAPNLGFQLLLPGVVAAIVAGVGRLSAALLGGFFMGLVQQFAGWFISTAWQDAVLFATLAGFLFLRPEGILGSPSKRKSV